MEMIVQIIKDIILGIVQGLTEFLPVSSSGHLTIAQHLMGMEEAGLFLDVMLHIGTLVAVFIFYRKLVWRMIVALFSLIRDIFSGKFKWSKMDEDRNLVVMLIIGLIPLFLLFIPIPGTEMNIKDLAELFSSEKYFIVTGIALLVTSFLLYVGIHINKKMPENKNTGIKGRTDYTVLDAITVGLGQFVAALFPGLSRSGTTLALGEMRGINKQSALDYTFILGMPSIVAAAVLEFAELEPSDVSVEMMLPVLCGVVAAAIVGYFAIVLFKWLLKTDKMIIFVIYTAIAGVVVTVISVIELVTGYTITII